MHFKEELKAKNELIAKFLGWFKEEDQPQTWWVINEHAKYVIYSEYKDRFGELPFHKSLEALQPVLTKLYQINTGANTDYPPSIDFFMAFHAKYLKVKEVLITGNMDLIFEALYDVVHALSAHDVKKQAVWF